MTVLNRVRRQSGQGHDYFAYEVPTAQQAVADGVALASLSARMRDLGWWHVGIVYPTGRGSRDEIGVYVGPPHTVAVSYWGKTLAEACSAALHGLEGMGRCFHSAPE